DTIASVDAVTTAAETTAKTVAPKPTTTVAPAATPPEVGVVNPSPVSSPSIRKTAQELGIDLTHVRGTGAGGRIELADIRAHIHQLQKPAAGLKTTPVKKPLKSMDFAKWGRITRKPLSSLRKTIGETVAETWATVPHVTQFDEADITELMALREKHAPAYEKKGAKLTVTPFVLKAIVGPLKRYPQFNASFDEAAGELVLKEYHHIGVAVDTEQGLIVPVVRDVDKKDLLELTLELQRLAERARTREVSLDELKGNSFTISNLGGVGGAYFTPIINKPDVAILGIGRGVMKPVVRGGKVEPRMMLPLALSYDHRVIDGADGARFIRAVVEAFAQFKEADVRLG
ncbi:MAG: 2-oxo acid dehydrogenase subunit E2, partial [Verrucomicrobiia bacterium]